MDENWFFSNIILILQRYVLWLFKIVANQADCFWLQQSSVIKFLVTEKCKPCEICRRMYDVYVERCFSKKML